METTLRAWLRSLAAPARPGQAWGRQAADSDPISGHRRGPRARALLTDGSEPVRVSRVLAATPGAAIDTVKAFCNKNATEACSSQTQISESCLQKAETSRAVACSAPWTRKMQDSDSLGQPRGLTASAATAMSSRGLVNSRADRGAAVDSSS